MVFFKDVGKGDVDDGMNVFIIEGIIDGFAVFAAADELRGFERLELMADGGAGHVEQSGQIADAQFTLFKGHENFQAGRITHDFVKISQGLQQFGAGEMVFGLFVRFWILDFIEFRWIWHGSMINHSFAFFFFLSSYCFLAKRDYTVLMND